MEFLLLGPMVVVVDGHPVVFGRPRERLLLAILLLDLGRPVEIERLVELLWDDDGMPRDPRAAVHVQVSRLRRRLSALDGPARGVSIESSGSSYAVRCDRAAVDVHVFAGLVGDALACADAGERAGMLRRALEMWRGDPLAGLTSAHLRDRICPRLYELRLAALEARVDADLELGRHVELIPELTALAAAYPASERITSALMLALYRAGRTSDALSVYSATANRLAEEMGLDPGGYLRSLQIAILREDPALHTGRPAGPDAPAGLPRPAQLPASPVVFVGRERELAEFRRASQSGNGIVTVSGMAGVGKTAFAVYAVHAVLAGFPDGCLFTDLRGFAVGGSPVEPADALDRMLRALGVAGPGVPGQVEERVTLLRSRLAGRRVCIILDNAASESQVEPLLPDAPGCLVVITSRLSLAGLYDATPVALDVLPEADACRLMSRLTGAMVEPEDDALAEVAELCGRLPLALRLAAARLRHRPRWTVAYLAGRLRDASGRLLELHAGQRSISAALDLSYEALPPEEADAFRRIGLTVIADIDARAMAAVAGLPLPRARHVLECLVDAHLVHEQNPGRYQLHSLVRLYAVTCAQTVPEADRDSALDRLGSYYLAGVAAAMALVAPHRRVQAPSAELDFPGFPSRELALGWLDSERDNLVTFALSAAGHGRPAFARTLAEALFSYLEAGSHQADAMRLFEHVHRVAREQGDDAGEAYGLRALGVFHGRAGRTGLAIDCLRRSLEILRSRDPAPLIAGVHVTLGEQLLARGEVDGAEDNLVRAAALYRQFADRGGEAHCLSSLSTLLWTRGRQAEAKDAVRRAASLNRDLGVQLGLAHATLLLGMFERMSGDDRLGLQELTSAGEIFGRANDRVGRSYALSQAGAAHAALGDHDQARQALRTALALAHDTGNYPAEFEALFQYGEALRQAGDLEGALHRQRAAVELADALLQPRDHVRAHDGIAQTLLALGLTEQAVDHWQRTLGRFGDIALPEVTAARERLASAAAAAG